MEYQVPQFIDVEDKIFGPLTWVQFVYVAGGTGACVAIFLYVPRLIGLPLIAIIAALSAALAFYKVNNKSFTDILEAALKYYLKEHLYLWKKVQKTDAEISRTERATPVQKAPAPRQKLGLSANRLHDLARSLDIKDSDPRL
jgi:PrgI family protein